MKKSVFALLGMIFLVAEVNASSKIYTEKVGQYTWRYQIDEDDAAIVCGVDPTPKGALKIPEGFVGDGRGWAYYEDLGSVVYPVEEIKSYAFSRCEEITSVEIPFDVLTIGDGAFSGCVSLRQVKFPPVEHIGRNAFSGTGLEKVSIPGMSFYCNLEIGDSAFYGCEALVEVDLPETTVETTIGSHCFSRCGKLASVKLRAGLKRLEMGLFYGCSTLETITIPKGVTSVGDSAFSDCTSLQSVTIPEGVTNIGDSAFSYCYSIRSVTIPNGTISLGSGAFAECMSLETVRIPPSLVSIGFMCFSGCSSLVGIDIDERNSQYAIKDGCLVSRDGKIMYLAPNQASVVVPDGVERIGESMQQDYLGETMIIGSAVFAEAVLELKISASVSDIFCNFGSCSLLNKIEVDEKNRTYRILDGCLVTKDTSRLVIAPAFQRIVVPEGVETIGAYALANAVSVTLPGSVQEIDRLSFGPFGGKLKVVYVAEGDEGRIGALIKEALPYSADTVKIRSVGNVGETLVPGEQVEIETGMKGYTVSGLPKGLSYSKTTGKITGAATKPTAAEGVVVKFTKSGAETEELTIIVTAIPTLKVTKEGDVDGCKVTGEGAYLVGKKVSLKATVPKGTVFMGWFDDEGIVATQATYSFTMGKENVALVAKFKKEVMSVGCETLSSKESFPVGVLGAEGGIKLDISTESGVKSVKVDKLPSGMKYDAKTGLVTGAPTKAGDNKVVITVTAKSGAVAKKEIKVKVAAMPVMAVGTFSGFVSVGEDNLGTFTLTTTDAGKLTAKVITAAGSVSFSKTCWDVVEKGAYRATLTTKKGEKLTLTLDSTAAWDANQLSGEFTTAAIAETRKTAAVPSRTYAVSAQRNAFGKTWYFIATGDETTGWTLDYAATAKAAALTVTLKADGSTAIAGKLPGLPDKKGKATSFKVSASGYANVGGLKEGAILADFAPVLTVNKVKTVLAITTNLWFDRKNEVGRSVGAARLVK